jgi:signal transduction histidine kinase
MIRPIEEGRSWSHVAELTSESHQWRLPKIGRAGRVWVFAAGLAAVSAGLVILGRGLDASISGPTVAWWVLAAVFALAEGFVVHLRVGRHAHSFSLSEVPLVVGLAFASPSTLMVAQAIGVGLTLALFRRQKPIRVGFNLAQRAFTTVVAIICFRAILHIGGSDWPVIGVAGLAAVILADMVAAILINAAIALAEGRSITLDEVVGVATAFAFANAALGLMATMMLAEHPMGVVLVLAPAATTFLAGRAYSTVQRRHDDLSMLFRATRLAQGSLDLDVMLSALLSHAREMFLTEVAEVLLFPGSSAAPVLRMCQDSVRSDTGLCPTQLDASEGVTARVTAEREGVLLTRPIANKHLARYFAERNIHDAMVVPLLADEAVLGTLLVGNRLGEFSTFDREDLELFQTFANHVAVAVHNASLVQRLESSLAQETEMSKLKDDFVATISHELRTPLTSVQGYLKTLLRSDMAVAPEELREFLGRADRQADRLRRLIEDLLFAAKVEASRPLQPTLVNLGELTRRVIEDSGPDIPPSRFETRLPPEGPVVRTEEEHVYRILRNLVENALKYSDADSCVTIAAHRAEEGVMLSVQDAGKGIPPAEGERIFERFYQVDQSLTRSVGGTGMGLYICRQAAEAIGARVWLERSDGCGSVFALWMPSDPREDSDLGVTGPSPALEVTKDPREATAHSITLVDVLSGAVDASGEIRDAPAGNFSDAPVAPPIAQVGTHMDI